MNYYVWILGWLGYRNIKKIKHITVGNGRGLCYCDRIKHLTSQFLA